MGDSSGPPGPWPQVGALAGHCVRRRRAQGVPTRLWRLEEGKTRPLLPAQPPCPPPGPQPLSSRGDQGVV